MSEITNETPVVKRFEPVSLWAIFISPQKTFAAMPADVSTWLMPMLVRTLSTILVVVVAGYFASHAAQTAEVPLPPDWNYWSPEMQQDFLNGQQTLQSPVLIYLLPSLGALIGLWVGWVVFAGVLRLTSTLLGGRGSMQSALNIAAWAGMVFLVRDVLRVLYMLIVGHEIVSAGLSGFASAPGFIAEILERTDIFFFWNIIMLAIGFSAVDGLPKNKALVGVAVIVFVMLLVGAGAGALGTALGGLAG